MRPIWVLSLFFLLFSCTVEKKEKAKPKFNSYNLNRNIKNDLNDRKSRKITKRKRLYFPSKQPIYSKVDLPQNKKNPSTLWNPPATIPPKDEKSIKVKDLKPKKFDPPAKSDSNILIYDCKDETCADKGKYHIVN